MRRSTLTVFALAAFLATLPLNAMAQSQRTDTRAYTCQQVAATVKHYEVLVLQWGPHSYDRFVGYPNYCQNVFEPRKAYLPTLDNPRCFVGYRCVQSRRD